MTDVVVDASAILEHVLRTEVGERVRSHIDSNDVALHVPALCDIEFVSALRRALRSGLLPVHRLWEAMEDYGDLPLHVYTHRLLLGRVLDLRENLTPYDATYVALAELLGAELLTADDRLARAAATHAHCRVLPVR